MDILKLKEALDEYFKKLNVEYQNEIIEHEGLKIETLMTHVYFKPLNNLKAHLSIVGYENGTTQITFNLGKAKTNSDLLREIFNFNIKSFGFKPVVELDELRFYNQAFYKEASDFIYNLDMCLQMFLSEANLERLKSFIPFLEK